MHMTCDSTALSAGGLGAVESWFRRHRHEFFETMSKRYEYVRGKIPNPHGVGFVDAVRIAIVEFSCLGERRLDIAGYPHADEHDALWSDAEVLKKDFQRADRRLAHELEDVEKNAEKAAAKSIASD